MADPFMEIRAMALLEFGCPPLPIANGRRAETSEPVPVNSHDLLGVFMAQAFKLQNTKHDQTRKAKQLDAEKTYRRRMLSCDGSVSAIYAIMSDYTRDYLAAYLLPPYSVHDVCILPMESIPHSMLAEIKRYHDALHSIAETEAACDFNLEALMKGCHRAVCAKSN